MQVNMLEAKNSLSKLVKAAQNGEEVVIANHGTPVAKIVAIQSRRKTTGFGIWKGQIEYDDDWDSPEINAAIATAMRNSPIFPPTRKRRPAKAKPATKRKRSAT